MIFQLYLYIFLKYILSKHCTHLGNFEKKVTGTLSGIKKKGNLFGLLPFLFIVNHKLTKIVIFRFNYLEK